MGRTIQLKDEGDLFEEDYTLNAAGSTDPVMLQRASDGIVVQLSGSATAITAIVERSTRDPNIDPNWAPAQTTAVTGDLSAGIAPLRYHEPSVAFWRVRVPALTGGDCKITIMGGKA